MNNYELRCYVANFNPKYKITKRQTVQLNLNYKKKQIIPINKFQKISKQGGVCCLGGGMLLRN